MSEAYIRCYAELNDRLPFEQRGETFAYPLRDPVSIRELAGDIGVPTSDIDLVLVDGRSVGLDFPVRNGDRVSFYPVFESFDVSSLTRVRAKPLREIRFVLDVHLGKLANHLRMLGFDTLYRNDYQDDELLRLAIEENRTLLSKDNALLRRPEIPRAYHVLEKDPRMQLVEVVRRFDLLGLAVPFTRCIECNTVVSAVPREEICHRLPLPVRSRYDEFHFCPACDRVYWKGSHYERMKQFVDDVMQAGKSL